MIKTKQKVEKGKRFSEVRKVNQLLKKIESKDVTEDNNSVYLGAALVIKALEKNKTKGEKSLGEESLGEKEDRKVKLKSLTKIWGD